MKIYRVSRSFLWLRGATKALATLAAVGLYIPAVTQPTPLPARLALLAGLSVFGYLMYVRQPRMPTQIALGEDGSIDFTGRRGTTSLRASDLRSIVPGLGRRTVRVRHAGGKLRLPNRFGGFYDFLATVKARNPEVVIRGF